VAKKLFDVDLYEHAPGSKALMDRLKAMPEVQQIETDKRAAAPAFSAYLKKALGSK
jgi:glutathione S-transferase